MRATCRLGFVVAALAVTAGPVAAQPAYDFVVIAESSDGGFGTFEAPSINAGGTVAFMVNFRNGDPPFGPRDDIGLFTGSGYVCSDGDDGVSTVTIATTPGKGGGVAGTFQNLAFGPVINDAGAVAFFGIFGMDEDGVGRILRWDGGTSLVEIANDGAWAGQGIFDGVILGQTMDEAGRVPFVGFSNNLGVIIDGAFLGDGVSTQTIADSLGTGGTFSSFGGMSASNESGVVTFHANLGSALEAGFFFGSSGTSASVIADTVGTGGDFVGFPGTAAINDSGDIIFMGSIEGSISGVYRYSAGVVTPVVVGGGDFFGTFSSPWINNSGDIVLIARRNLPGDGGTGTEHLVLTGPDPVVDKVIGTGDPFCGSTIKEMLSDARINDAGQIVFQAFLEDGRRVIARADPPRPSCPALLDYVQSLVLSPKGAQQSAVAKVEAACRAIERESYDAAFGVLVAFINWTEAQSGKKLDAAEAVNLATMAEEVINSLPLD